MVTNLIYFSKPRLSFVKMHRSVKSSPISLFALVTGIVLVTLLVIDGVPSVSEANFGSGFSNTVTADSTLAVFMIGGIVGMISGIGLFFGYLMWREKQAIEQPDELDVLFEELAREEEEALFVEDLNTAKEEKAESLDPWERPSDWWKRSGEE